MCACVCTRVVACECVSACAYTHPQVHNCPQSPSSPVPWDLEMEPLPKLEALPPAARPVRKGSQAPVSLTRTQKELKDNSGSSRPSTSRCESGSPMCSQGRILAGCLFPPLGLISFLNNVRRYRRSAAPAAASRKWISVLLWSVHCFRVVERALFYKYGEGSNIPQPEGSIT